jgi:hypothetical protein
MKRVGPAGCFCARKIFWAVLDVPDLFFIAESASAVGASNGSVALGVGRPVKSVPKMGSQRSLEAELISTMNARLPSLISNFRPSRSFSEYVMALFLASGVAKSTYANLRKLMG